MKETSTLIALALVVLSANAQSCPDNHHPHRIDLGLPTGTLWACCNVGATTPEAYGGYYAWGETEVKTTYNWSNYSHCEGSESTCVKLGDKIAGTEYDVAHVKWGGYWEMPVWGLIQELLDNCTYEWTTVNGVSGGKFTSKKNGGSIFLPAAGIRSDDKLEYTGREGDYWSSTPGLFSDRADGLYVGSSNTHWAACGDRYRGFNVRPVWVGNKNKPAPAQPLPLASLCPDNNHPHMIDLGLPSGTKWACCNVADDPTKQNPTNYGGYYAWGETKMKATYNWSNYSHCEGTENTCKMLGDIAGTQYDVAHVKWGGSWVMPSHDQINELLNNCTYEKTTVNGVRGGKFTSKKNGSIIFFPAAGRRDDGTPVNVGFTSDYWSSTQGSSPKYANDLYLVSSRAEMNFASECYNGYTVRPVFK